MKQSKLKQILKEHKEWLNDNSKGKRADLREADLDGANLWEVNLRGADLRRADLKRAYLWRTDFSGANLEGADLREADLYHTKFFPISLQVLKLTHTKKIW
jgi:uncharacterized protein YjbI with pentapeptide repeats